VSADGQIVEGVERGRGRCRRAGFDPRSARRFAVCDADAAVPGGARTGRARLKSGTQTIGQKLGCHHGVKTCFRLDPQKIDLVREHFSFSCRGKFLRRGGSLIPFF
jgi:hypothetical protein